MGKVIDFRPAAQRNERAEIRKANATIDPLIKAMLEMQPGDLADFCRAVCQGVQYIERTKDYSYFSDSARLACLIGSKYVFDVTGKAAAPAVTNR